MREEDKHKSLAQDVNSEKHGAGPTAPVFRAVEGLQDALEIAVALLLLRGIQAGLGVEVLKSCVDHVRR